MNKSFTELRTRFVAIFALLLMFMSMAGGIVPTGTHSVDDLWNTVTSDSVGQGGLNGANTNMGTVVDKTKEIAKTVTSILTVISFVCLLFWVAKLAMSAGNPQTRKVALTGILFAGIALALFGGSWVVVSFFWNVLN